VNRELHDTYFKQAKREGYVSRAAYKLTEIDERRRILRRGDAVLDCGCAPGSWLQVALQRVGPKGIVVGIDLQALEHRFREPNVHVLQGDLRETDDAALRAPLAARAVDASETEDSARFDVVLSDMAPNTTGDRTIDHHQSIRLCRLVLQRCPGLLRPGGALVVKVLEGEAYAALLADLRTCFKQVKGLKPDASRRESTEIFAVASGYRPGATAADAPDDTPPPPRKPEPPAGWGR
jgi:23S rRNA (uridine2552-2'-O)-methyltransferase